MPEMEKSLPRMEGKRSLYGGSGFSQLVQGKLGEDNGESRINTKIFIFSVIGHFKAPKAGTSSLVYSQKCNFCTIDFVGVGGV